MAKSRPPAGTAKTEVNDALADGRRRASSDRTQAVVGPQAVLALQRSAGNAAVSALVAAKMKSSGGQGVTEIDAALKEIRRDEPEIDTVEKGLKAARATGVPVDLEGTKPPPSALAVTKTGFGPESVPGKKPAPRAKQVPTVHPLGKAGARAAKAGGSGKGKAGGPGKGKAAGPGKGTAAGPGKGTDAAGSAGAVAAPLAGGATAATMDPAGLSRDRLLQPPVPPAAARPEDDPAFTRVTSTVGSFARDKKAHPPAASKAREAQDAALAPPDDLSSQGKAAKVDTMDAQPVGSFDKKAFIAAVKAAIEAKSPKTLKEADNYAASGSAGEVKGEVKGLVTAGKDGQAKDIEAATEAPPDQSKAVAKPVTPMVEEQPGKAVPVPAAGAVPKPAPAEQVNLAAGKHEANQVMAEADVTEPQLAQSNEPEFQQALADKQAAATHADTAPAQFRQHEQQVIGQGRSEAAAQTAAAVEGMQSAKGTALAKLVADKTGTKSKDEAKRAEVTAKVQAIFAATEADVKKILDGLDPKVEAAFDQGEAAARKAFETYVAAKMSAYKKDRYGGWLGGLRWAKDKLLGMPSKVNEFYEAGREIYLKQMDGVISRVADIVANDLTAAKRRIASGKAEIAAYVKRLPADLQKVGAEASSQIGDSFEQLENDVDAAQESVVDSLATRYVEARKGLDERIEALQAENSGLVAKAVGAIKGVINTIRELAAMLSNVLSRAAGVVGEIIKSPVRFLGNLIAGVKGGILRFKDNILDHLRKGLMSWLFGALAEGGVELPDTFDVKGIIKLLASIFGVTWANIRRRLVKQIGEKAMGAVEKGVGLFQTMAGQGIAGLWEMLVEKLGDIKEMILEQVKDFVVTRIITAGITWLIGLLNPAAAFIKACKLIYDIVMFFVNNAGRIMKFVNTVIDSVADIVRGNVGAVVNKINDVLGQMVPIIIGFLASLIGLGGIGQRIRKIVDTLRKPFTSAIDFVIKTGLKLAGPIIRGIKGISGKVKAKVAAGKAWVKGKADAAKAKASAVKDKVTGRGTSGGETTGGPTPGQTAALAEADRMLASKPDHATAVSKTAEIGKQHGTRLRFVVENRETDGERVHVQTSKTRTHVLPAAPIDAAKQAELQKVRTTFVGIVTGFGGDTSRAEAVCTYRPAASASAEAIDDFLRDANRACRVVGNLPVPAASKVDVQKAATEFAFRRRGTAGNPGEFANVVEYYMTHWTERYIAERARQSEEVTAGRRQQTDKSEAARVVTAAMATNPESVGRALYRDRARVEGLDRTGVTAPGTLTDSELVDHIRAQAGQLTFSSPTAGAYHPRKHRREMPSAERTSRAVIDNYHAMATKAVQNGTPTIKPVGTSRQVNFAYATKDDAGQDVTLTVMVFARPDGRVVMATFGSFLR